MIKICIDARMIDSSGIGRYLKNIVLNLDRNVFDIYLILNSNSSFINKGFSNIFISTSIYSIKEQFSLPLAIPFCDIFWSPHFNIPLLPIKAKKRVVNIHDLYHLEYFHKLSYKEKIYAKYMLLAASRYADVVITPSVFSKTEIIKYFPRAEEKINIILHGVDKDTFQHKGDGEKFKKIKDKYNIDISKYFLFVGNFKEHKNFSCLLEAFKLLLETTSEEVSLIVIGKIQGLRNSDDIFSKAKNIGLSKKVHVVNEATDEELLFFYSNARALVFPSFYEGFGFPPIEAMCCKTPVISSNRASMPEVCGDAVLYFNPQKPKELCSLLKKVLESQEERKRLIDLGFLRKDQFCLEKSVKLHEKIFKKVLGEG
jgi:glycosyltransferase involved in cell wall biosynthesis